MVTLKKEELETTRQLELVNNLIAQERGGAIDDGPQLSVKLMQPFDLLAYNGDKESQEFVLNLIRELGERGELGKGVRRS